MGQIEQKAPTSGVTPRFSRRAPLLGLLVPILLVGAAAAPAPSRAAPPDPLADPTAFADPPAAVRPKFRWWWGDLLTAVPLEDAELEAELDAIAKAGFGGVEVAFSGGQWGNDEQRRGLRTALTAARRLGLQVDQTIGAVWPVTTPNTEHGSGLSEQELMYGRQTIDGPTAFAGAPPRALDDYGQKPGKLVAVTAAKVLAEGPPVLTAGSAPARSTILDPASLVDLTAKLGPDGTVRWDVPAGRWLLFGFWQREASEGVIDHLSRDSAAAATAYVDGHQLGDTAALLAGVGGSFFEDSLELDVAELFWTHSFQAEFTKRRGYDMTRFLPLMFVQGMNHFPVPEKEPTPDFELPSGAGSRYRHDYYETLTDLYLDNHVDELSTWAKRHGMRFRTQPAYGNTFEVIRSAREVARRGGLADDESLAVGDNAPFDDTLRNWRYALDHYRTLAGGSHQGGENEVSTEIGAVFGRELMMSLPEYKRAMDKEWAAGVTRPIVHGYSHQAASSPWPGVSRFNGLFSEAWNHRTFPQWAMWKPLADYWARGALVLQRGTARTDVAVYRDGFLAHASASLGLVADTLKYQVDDGLGVTLAGTPAFQALIGAIDPARRPLFDAAELERAGYTLEYVDPVGLRERQAVGESVLYPDGPAYRAIVIDERALPGATAQALLRAAERGLAVVFVGSPPARGTSGADAGAEDARVRDAVRAIVALPTTRRVARQSDVREALGDLGVAPASDWSRPVPVYSQRRQAGDTDVYYLWNAGRETQRFTGSFRASGSPSRLDLWTGAIEPVAIHRAVGDRVRVPLTLAPGETMALAFRKRSSRRAHVLGSTADDVVLRGGEAEVRARHSGEETLELSDGSTRRVTLPDLPRALTVTGWRLHVDAVGPAGPSGIDVALTGLGDWRHIPQLAFTSGTGTYTAEIALPDGWVADDRGTLLDVGRVEGAAQVFVNDRLAAPDVDGGRAIDVTDLLAPGRNALRVVLTTTLKNQAVASLPVTLLSRPVFAVQLGRQASGLLGPVRLVPLGRARVALPRLPCATRRSLTVHVPNRRSVRVRSATVAVDGRVRRVKARRAGRRVAVPVALRGAKGETVRVRVTVRLVGGKVVRTQRTYRLCRRGPSR